MYAIGEKIIYGENGVCTVEKIAPLEGANRDKMYYYLTPLVGSGTYFTPVDTSAFMRPVMSREDAEAFIDSIPGIAPAVCNDNRFNHVDAFYKELFKQHTCEALVSIVTLDIHDNAPIRYIRLKGLDAEAVYRDAQSGQTCTGAALMYAGLPVPKHRGEYVAWQIHLIREQHA